MASNLKTSGQAVAGRLLAREIPIRFERTSNLSGSFNDPDGCVRDEAKSHRDGRRATIQAMMYNSSEPVSFQASVSLGG
jgi:hypothetical protein